MAQDTIKFSLGGVVSLEHFKTAIGALTDLIEMLTDQANAEAAVDWIVDDLRGGSATIAVRGRSDTDEGMVAVHEATENYRHLGESAAKRDFTVWVDYPRVIRERVIDYLWHPDSSPIQIIGFHEAIALEALRRYRDCLAKFRGCKSKGKDFVHLVTAKSEKVDKFFTTEKAMEKWGPELGFKVCEPHRVSPVEESPLFNPSGAENVGKAKQ